MTRDSIFLILSSIWLIICVVKMEDNKNKQNICGVIAWAAYYIAAAFTIMLL